VSTVVVRILASAGWVIGALAVGWAVIDAAADPAFPAVMFVFATVGLVVVTVRPRHPVGWLLVAQGTFSILGDVAGPYARATLDADPASLTGAVAGWLNPWVFLLGIVSAWTMFLLYPDGKVPSPRWRPVLWLALAGFALTLLTGAFATRFPAELLAELEATAHLPGAGSTVATAAYYSVFGLIPLSLASLVARFRVSGRVVRQQMKWPLLAAVPWAAGIGLLAIRGTAPWEAPPAVAVLLFVGFFAVPVRSPPAPISRSRPPPSRSRRPSGRCAAASSVSSIGVSAGPATTPRARWRPSPTACGTRSTSTPWPPSSVRRPPGRYSPGPRGCGWWRADGETRTPAMPCS
jgi:hypothetical protein